MSSDGSGNPWPTIIIHPCTGGEMNSLRSLTLEKPSVQEQGVGFPRPSAFCTLIILEHLTVSQRLGRSKRKGINKSFPGSVSNDKSAVLRLRLRQCSARPTRNAPTTTEVMSSIISNIATTL